MRQLRKGVLLLVASAGLLSIVALALTPAAAPAPAQPYVPSSGSVVLENVPKRSRPSVQTAAAVAGRAASTVTSDPQLAADHASREWLNYQADADPRYLGRAEAALAAFWDQPEAPTPILILRAKIRAAGHEFKAALIDLDRALARDPAHAQALLERASIQLVLGRFQESRVDCEALKSLRTEPYATACLASVNGVTGEAKLSARALSEVLTEARFPDPASEVWALSLLGELSARAGETKVAEEHYRAALQRVSDDSYTLAALTDLLLDLEREGEVLALLEARTRVDALLLRLAIAERRLGSTSLEAHTHELSRRFEEARLRGSRLHQREEARFELWINENEQRALQLALDNFAVQREPADVRIALEAALACRERMRVEHVIAFVRRARLEGTAIQQLSRALEQL